MNQEQQKEGQEMEKTPQEISRKALWDLGADIPHAQNTLHSYEILPSVKGVEEQMIKTLEEWRRDKQKVESQYYTEGKLDVDGKIILEKLKGLLHYQPPLEPGYLRGLEMQWERSRYEFERKKEFLEIWKKLETKEIDEKQLKRLSKEISMDDYDGLRLGQKTTGRLTQEDRETFIADLEREIAEYDKVLEGELPKLIEDKALKIGENQEEIFQNYEKMARVFNQMVQDTRILLNKISEDSQSQDTKKAA